MVTHLFVYMIAEARLLRKSRFVHQYIPLGYNQLYSSLLMILAASKKRCTVGVGSGEWRMP